MRTTAVAVLAVVAGASAQSLVPSYITHVYYDDCVSSMSTPVVTETDEVIITTCPSCTHKSTPSATASVSGVTLTPVPTLHTTVYTTSYVTLCSTGLVPNTYTVTETCSGETPTWPMTTSNYLPPGFTTTVTVCTVCHSDHPTTVTLTVPCDTTQASSPVVSPTGSASVSAGTASPASSSSSSPTVSATGSGLGGSPSASSSSSASSSPSASSSQSASSGAASALEDVTTTTTVCAKCSHSSTSGASGSVTGNASGLSQSVSTPTTPTTSNTPTTTLTPTSSGVVMATGVAAAHFPDWRVSAGFLGAVAAGAIFL
ncbi:hypothetical protein IWZ03DRAFT_108511 [Phyllosticta citriasiana]|uniref:Uncharacterized protein n=1 Tax=Phyllosticta citriasiana TaxID=595635 RepID=A0ABR1KWQ9_9PEZI